MDTPFNIVEQNANMGRFFTAGFSQDPVPGGLAGSRTILAPIRTKKSFFRSIFMGIHAKRGQYLVFRKINGSFFGEIVPE